MTDIAQAMYDAVRSRFHGDFAGLFQQAAREALDISWQIEQVKQEFIAAAAAQQAPHVLMRPAVFPDGNAWCALYGEDLMMGVAGFGDTPAAACAAFDEAWQTCRPPPLKQEG